MKQNRWLALRDRGVVAMRGSDARSFLQSLITNDVEKIDCGRSIYSALLTPQGKLMYDFFVAESNDKVLIDCSANFIFDLVQKFNMYKLRADVKIEDCSHSYVVLSLLRNQKEIGNLETFSDGVEFADSRCPKLGYRAIVPTTAAEIELGRYESSTADRKIFDATRIQAGVPDCAVDCTPGDFFALECCLDDFDGISFEKGCFVGQEVTTRMKHRQLVRKKFVPVSFDTSEIPFGTPISDGVTKVGEVRSCIDGHGIAMLRLDHADSETLLADELPISVNFSNP